MVKHLQGIEPVTYSKSTEIEPDVVLSLNELQYPISPKVIAILKVEAENASRYVYSGDKPTTDLQRAVAAYAGVEMPNICLDASLDLVLNHIPRVFLEPGDKTVFISPTYPEVEFGTLRAGGTPVKVPLTGEFELNADAVLEAIDEKTKIVFICNPNNPTSNAFPREEILRIVENCKCIAVVDECYYEYCGETVADSTSLYPNMLVLRSFSKAFGLAGAKASYLIGDEEIINCYKRILSGFELTRFGVFGSLVALNDLEYYKELWKQVKDERQSLIANLRALGLRVFNSRAAYVFLDVLETGKRSAEIKDLFLRNYKILVRDVGVTFPDLGDKYVSFAVGTPVVNALLVEGFEDAIIKKI